jgi:predicted DNA-binding protein
MMMSDMSEKERRETAYAHRGSVIEDSAEPVEPRRLDQMVSVRLQPDLLVALRRLAEERKVTVSELLREAAEHLLDAQGQHPIEVYGVKVEVAREAHAIEPEAWSRGSGPIISDEPVSMSM